MIFLRGELMKITFDIGYSSHTVQEYAYYTKKIWKTAYFVLMNILTKIEIHP